MGCFFEPCLEEIYGGTFVLYVRIASGYHFVSYREVFGDVVVKFFGFD